MQASSSVGYNVALSLVLACCAALLMGGCTSTTADLREKTRLRTDVTNVRGDMQVVSGRIDETELALKELREEVRGLRDSDAGSSTAFGKRLAEMDAKIAAVDAAREADKKEIIEYLSDRIAEIINKHAAQAASGGGSSRPVKTVGGSGPAGGQGEGHVVKENETLSGIARQYGVPVGAVVDANKLKNANSIVVGQKLIIPR